MFTYRGRVVNDNDIAFINELIARNPNASRWALSRQLCREWHWVQPNGELRDMVCRGMMLELHRAGHIRLPEKKRSPRNPLADRKKPEKIEIELRPLQTELSAIRPLTFSDDVAIESTVEAFGRSSFRVRHRIMKGGEMAVEGFETRVWAVRDPDDPNRIKSQQIPPDIVEKLSRT